MLSMRALWALTFMLEQYVNVVDEDKNYPFKNRFPFSERIISTALKMLFREGIFSPKEFSRELANQFNLAISPKSLVDMSHGDFNICLLNITRK